MYRILLVCSGGMSTSLLVLKLEKEAQLQGIACEIWAVGLREYIDDIKKADVCLLGPQIHYLLPTIKKVGDKIHVPVASMDMLDFGRCHAKNILQFALALLKEKASEPPTYIVDNIVETKG